METFKILAAGAMERAQGHRSLATITSFTSAQLVANWLRQYDSRPRVETWEEFILFKKQFMQKLAQ